MGEKRHVCGQCKWFYPFTEVCTNGDSERRADFVDQMNDSCGMWESFLGLAYQRDNLTKSDEIINRGRERLKNKVSGEKRKNRIQHKKPVGGG